MDFNKFLDSIVTAEQKGFDATKDSYFNYYVQDPRLITQQSANTTITDPVLATKPTSVTSTVGSPSTSSYDTVFKEAGWPTLTTDITTSKGDFDMSQFTTGYNVLRGKGYKGKDLDEYIDYVNTSHRSALDKTYYTGAKYQRSADDALSLVKDEPKQNDVWFSKMNDNKWQSYVLGGNQNKEPQNTKVYNSKAEVDKAINEYKTNTLSNIDASEEEKQRLMKMTTDVFNQEVKKYKKIK